MSLAEKMETLAVDVRAVSEEDADLALEMARGIREEAAAAHAEALRVAEMERRVAAREAEEREAQAAARESARRADEERVEPLVVLVVDEPVAEDALVLVALQGVAASGCAPRALRRRP